MRKIMTVSLPKEMLGQVKKMTKDGKYSSVSEFCRYVIRWYIEKKSKEKN